MTMNGKAGLTWAKATAEAWRLMRECKCRPCQRSAAKFEERNAGAASARGEGAREGHGDQQDMDDEE